MPLVAVLKSVSFESKSSFNDIKKNVIKSYLENKIDFVNIKNTIGLFMFIQKVFGNQCADVTNCYYDDKYLIQSFSVDTSTTDRVHEFVIIVKRLINDDDTYTYIGFDDAKQDEFTYEDVQIDDIINILTRKTIIGAVCAHIDGTISDRKILIEKTTDDMGKILVKKTIDDGAENGTENNVEDLIYLNVSNIVNKHCENANLMNDILKEKMNAYCAHHIFLQIDIGVCILNCFYKSLDENKNEMLSSLLGHDVFGDVIIYVQSNMNDDRESVMYIDKCFFKNLLKYLSMESLPHPKNKHFYNIYKEILD